MAYVPQQIPKEEENQLANKNPTTAFPVPPQGGGSSGTGTNAAPGVGTSTQFGSNAAKLSDYLKANKDQVPQFGNQLAGDLTQGFNQAKGSIDSGFGGFTQQVSQGWNQPDTNKIDAAANNPTEFASKPENVKQFQGWFNDQYQGPENFESTQPYTDINANVNKAVENASLVKNPSGLSTYLTNAGYENNATPGMKTLDTALLMGNPDSQTAIKNAAAPYSGLNDYLSQRTQDANQTVTNAKQQTNQTRQDVQDRFTGANGVIPSFQNDLNSRVNQARQTASTQANNLKSQFTGGQLSDSDLANLGLNRYFYEDILNNNNSLRSDFQSPVDVSPYFNIQNPESALTQGNIATSDDYAKANALASLTGQDLSGFLNPANANQAGTADTNLAKFDVNKADTDVANSLAQNDQGILSKFANPPKETDDKTKQLLLDVFSRRSGYLNPLQKQWYDANKTIGIGTNPVLPPNNNPINPLGLNQFTNPTTGNTVS